MDPVTAAYLISLGWGAVSSWMQKRQQDKAAGREVDASKAALDLEKYYFEQEQQRSAEDRAEDRRRYEDTQRQNERAYADMGPYRAIGRGALSKLGIGTGIDLPENLTDTRYGPQETLLDTNGRGRGGPMPGGSLATLGGQPPTPPGFAPNEPGTANASRGASVSIRTPTGHVVLVPWWKVNEAIANGGTRV